ncbi:helix-turn-helix domain-containing protein [Methylobacterium sp. Leaf85]|uniref:helix-turn-helix domain-containing protein n=1 Tax=Methylobacterium sp. Leaf85 TaxID=1736241 RepID=UPI000AE6C01B|nr:helix-turn-helix domain-containing protein [Methylobacterium sp. Leaf85]
MSSLPMAAVTSARPEVVDLLDTPWADMPKTLNSMMKVVARITGLPLAHILGPRRTAALVKARMIGFWACRRFVGRSWHQIGTVGGGRTNSAVMSGVRRVGLVIVALKIPPETNGLDAMRLLWEADWPRFTREDLIEARRALRGAPSLFDPGHRLDLYSVSELNLAVKGAVE